ALPIYQGEHINCCCDSHARVSSPKGNHDQRNCPGSGKKHSDDMNHTVSCSLCAIIVPQYAIHWSRPSLIPQHDSRMWLLKEARLDRKSEERSLCTITTQTSQQRGHDKVQ